MRQDYQLAWKSSWSVADLKCWEQGTRRKNRRIHGEGGWGNSQGWEAGGIFQQGVWGHRPMQGSPTQNKEKGRGVRVASGSGNHGDSLYLRDSAHTIPGKEISWFQHQPGKFHPICICRKGHPAKFRVGGGVWSYAQQRFWGASIVGKNFGQRARGGWTLWLGKEDQLAHLMHRQCLSPNLQNY